MPPAITEARCDIWDVTDLQARLFLAILNKLRGSEVRELRMSLLLGLLEELPSEDLAAYVPESAAYLERIQGLAEATANEKAESQSSRPDLVVTQFCLTREQHGVLSRALEPVSEQYDLSNSSQALAKMAALCLGQFGASSRKAAA